MTLHLAVLAETMVPLCFVIVLGLLAGRFGVMKVEQSEVLSNFAMTFCLPALLFDATARTDLSRFADWRFFLGLSLGLAIIYGFGLTVALLVARLPLDAATLQAAAGSTPDMAAVGVPILIAVAGKVSVLAIVVGNLFMSFVILPVSLVLMAAGQSHDRTRSPWALVGNAVLAAAKNPLVWAPLAGLAIVVLHIPYPGLAHRSLTFIGDALTGVLLFAMGLFLSSRPFRVGRSVTWNVVLKLLAQPAVMFALALALGVGVEDRNQMILLGGLPTATVLALFAIEYKVYGDETEATIIVSALLSVVTLGLLIAWTGTVSHG